jgi:hypothetical protein
MVTWVMSGMMVTLAFIIHDPHETRTFYTPALVRIARTNRKIYIFITIDRQKTTANMVDQLTYITKQLYTLQNTTYNNKMRAEEWNIDMQKLLSALNTNDHTEGVKESDIQKLLSAIQNINNNNNNNNKDNAELLADIQKKITSLSLQTPSNNVVNYKKLNNEEKEGALALIDKQLELKRASHEIQRAATKKYLSLSSLVCVQCIFLYFLPE